MDEGTFHTFRTFIAFGLTLLLVMLRLEAAHFGAAEYDEPTAGRLPSIWRRLGQYDQGIGGGGAVLWVLPSPGCRP